MRNIKPKTMWRHFKGQYYLIEEVAKDANTQDFIIVYRALFVLTPALRSILPCGVSDESFLATMFCGLDC